MTRSPTDRRWVTEEEDIGSLIRMLETYRFFMESEKMRSRGQGKSFIVERHNNQLSQSLGFPQTTSDLGCPISGS